MRNFGGKRSTTWVRHERAVAADRGPGKRTLTEMLPAVQSSSPAQREADVRVPVMPAGPPRTIYELFGGLQRKATRETGHAEQIPALGAGASGHGALALRSSGGDPLPGQLRIGLEQMSGLSMDAVTVHRNSAEPAKVGAKAYTRGTEIYLGPGQDKHLPHEAWHVVQQLGGTVPATGQVGGAPINADPALEDDADRHGSAALTLAAAGTCPIMSAVHDATGDTVQMVVVDDEDVDESFEVITRDGVQCVGVLRRINGGGWYTFEVEGKQVLVRGQTNILRRIEAMESEGSYDSYSSDEDSHAGIDGMEIDACANEVDEINEVDNTKEHQSEHGDPPTVIDTDVVLADTALEALGKSFGQYKTFSKGIIIVLEEREFRQAYDAIYGQTAFAWSTWIDSKFGGTILGFHHNRTSYIKNAAPTTKHATMMHETLHANAAAAYKVVVGTQFDEGTTELMTQHALRPNYAFQAYKSQLRCVMLFLAKCRQESFPLDLFAAYLLGDEELLKIPRFVKMMGGSWTNIREAMEDQDWQLATELIEALKRDELTSIFL